jgi:hypothetical protein
VNGDTDNKKEERKNKIGGGASIPWCVPEWRINVLPGSGIVYKNHSRYRDASEDIQGFESFVRFHDSIYIKRLICGSNFKCIKFDTMRNIVLTSLMMVALAASAQKADKLIAIPHPLFWENKPLSYSIVNDNLTIVAGEKPICFATRMLLTIQTMPRSLFSKAMKTLY